MAEVLDAVVWPSGGCSTLAGFQRVAIWISEMTGSDTMSGMNSSPRIPTLAYPARIGAPAVASGAFTVAQQPTIQLDRSEGGKGDSAGDNWIVAT